ncbi:MAG: flagellar basal-body rod protein FlgG [Nitrospirota bacterium]|nr:flagellar basal-body rod protein FlgG [Nitrospirota bacterium]
MMRALHTAASGMMAQQTNVDVTSNNLANVNTVGFKKSRADFNDLLYQTLAMAGAQDATGNQVPTGIQIGLGSRLAATQKLFGQGPLLATGNSLDLAIEGDGFFQILDANGTTNYTRSGSFKLDANGRIVNSMGLPMEPEVTIPADTISISISPDGTVSVIQPGAATPTQVGTITMARFPNPGGLQAMGEGLFRETDASGLATTGTPGLDGLGNIIQGYAEGSNVEVVEEMVNLITAQRAYETNSKAIKTADEMLQEANSLRR